MKAAARTIRPAGARERWFIGILLPMSEFLASTLSRFVETGDEASGTPLLQVLWLVVYFIAATLIAKLGALPRFLAARSGPLLAVTGLALLSTLWSSDPFITFKEAVELAGTTLVGYYVVSRFSLEDFLEIVSWSALGCCVLSLAYIAAWPSHGIVPPWGEGPGAWQGIYTHKNALGLAMAFSVVTVALLLPEAGGRRRIRLGVTIALATVLLIGARSATSSIVCIATLVIAALSLLFRTQRYGFAARIACALFALAAFVWIAIAGFDLGPLFELVGRDPNLTGRTDFWPYLQTAVWAKPLAGYGYNGFFAPTGPANDFLNNYLIESGGWTPTHAHNSLLQLLLDFGLIGTALVLAWISISVVRAIRYSARDRRAIAIWPLTTIAFLALAGTTETVFLNFNDPNWIFFIAATLYPVRDLFEPARVRTAVASPSANPRREFAVPAGRRA